MALVERDRFDRKSLAQSEPLSSSGGELSCITKEGHSGRAAVVVSMTSKFELRAARSCASYRSGDPALCVTGRVCPVPC